MLPIQFERIWSDGTLLGAAGGLEMQLLLTVSSIVGVHGPEVSAPYVIAERRQIDNNAMQENN